MVNLHKLLERLTTHEVEFVLVGGLAAIMYGCSVITKDVDVCVPFSLGNLRKLHEAIADLHPYHRFTPQEMPFVLKEGLEDGLKNLYIMTDLGIVDFLGEIIGVGGYDEVRAHSIEVKTAYGSYRMVSIDKLIDSKAAADRDKDRVAVKMLRGIRDSARPSTATPPSP